VYTYFKIRNFRCFQELELDDLGLVNLIAGVNNAGKTALLEAIFLHGGAYNPGLTVRLNAFRGVETVDLTVGRWVEHPLSSFFNQFDVSKPIELVGKDTVTGRRVLRLKAVGESLESTGVYQEGGVSVTDESDTGYIRNESKGVLSSSEVAKVLELEYEQAAKQGTYRMIIDRKGAHVDPIPPAPPFQTYFQSARQAMSFGEQARLYGNLELHDKQDPVLRILGIIEPRLKDIRSIAIAGGSMLHGRIDGIDHLIPLPIMGGGMIHLANLALHIGNAPNGVVLVDEVENGLHYSVMFKVWKAIALAARQSNTQIFATTHSWECIRAAHEAFASDEEYNFRLHRLGWLNGEIKRVTYDQGTLAASLKHELEVR
jgi:predicted ATPase